MAKILFKAGEIVLVNLDPTKGGEKNRTRPCVVLVGSGHPWGLVIVVPIIDGKGKRPSALFVSIPANKASGLKKSSCVDCFQIRCISEERVVSKVGAIAAGVFSDIRSRFANILDIGEEHIGIYSGRT